MLSVDTVSSIVGCQRTENGFIGNSAMCSALSIHILFLMKKCYLMECILKKQYRELTDGSAVNNLWDYLPENLSLIPSTYLKADNYL